MSMFWCEVCNNLRDSDDGCEEAPGPDFGLICADCMAENEEAEGRRHAINVGGKRDGGSAG